MSRHIIGSICILVAAGTLAGCAGRQPYATHFAITVPTASNSENQHSPDPIPVNKRLVIEFVSLRMFVPAGQTPLFALNDLINGVSHAYVLPLTFVGPTAVGNEYRVTQLLKLYSDGSGTTGPGAQCARFPAGGAQATCSITLSGYLVNK